ncbi:MULTISPECIES: alginate lyase family protein [Bizionia]|uniref:Uncharacterized protein n=1 Tax=Bizionia algoritergicola TaxID=291187 RepID=A0A5D0R2E4_9FLAO|nr:MULTISPECIES: alginate lyase family protein [Bizionia]OBX21837.1 hypothetical protein BAA08_10825 [Bizionia sp. APA-3]TYB75066.1 hypothetical protein ES675_02735 [Bizionia algoritergicola]
MIQNKLKWYYNRAKLMSVKEVLFYRIPQFLQTKIKGKFQQNKIPSSFVLNPNYIAKPYIKKDLVTLFKQKPFHAQYHVFNTTLDVFSLSNWRKDYCNTITSPLNYYGNINRQDFEINGDVKFTLELSRLEFLPFLAFKYVENQDPIYLDKLENIVVEWTAQNPYLKSINWTSGIEIGIRSVNLIYTHSILNQFNLLSNTLDVIIKNNLACNYQYLKNHLSLYSSANNHLMAELMGLNIISSYFKVPQKEALKWRNMFYLEVENQINADGVHMELCSRYHAEVSDQILITVTFLQQAGITLSENVMDIFKTLFLFTEHLDYLSDETIFGDNDEGFVINPYFHNNFSLYQSQLASSNYLFQTNFKVYQEIDFRNYLIFGSDFHIKNQTQNESDTLFETSGYCFMYDHDNQTKLSFDVGTIGDHISAAHGHSDIFHFNFSTKGVPFLIDSGTYQYHSKYSFWRNYFRGITAHNTVSINNKNHATNNGRMSWINLPETIIDSFIKTNTKTVCQATTDAFKRFGVTHSRSIDFNKTENNIEVIDQFIGNNNKIHTGDLFLHFHPNVKIEKIDDNKLKLSNNDVTVFMESELFRLVKITFGNTEEPLGWFSNAFNVKQETTTLTCSFNFSKKHQTNILINY